MIRRVQYQMATGFLLKRLCGGYNGNRCKKRILFHELEKVERRTHRNMIGDIDG